MSESNTLKVEIVSPEKPLFSGDALAVVVPAYDGEVGILPKHAPMLAQLGTGEVRVTSGTLGGEHIDYFAISGGFVETSDNKVIILTEEASAPADVDGAALETQISELKAKLMTKQSPEDREKLENQLAWAQAKHGIAKRVKQSA